MTPKRAKVEAAYAGLELWWDRHQKLWTLTTNDLDRCDHLSAGSLRSLDAATFDRCYVQPLVDHWRQFGGGS